jgi:hemerythrin-like domain-containing protein
MRPSEVRHKIQQDHVAIRGMLLSLEHLSGQVLEGERALLGALRLEGEALLKTLLEHMDWEDRNLAPVLRAADAWGEERATRLDADHREQRELFAHILESVQDQSRPAALIARNVLDLVQLLREDMDLEESELLDPSVVRDDVVAIDVETG